MTAGPEPTIARTPRWLLRAVGTVILLIGLFGMHGLGVMAAPMAMASARTSMDMTMSQPDSDSAPATLSVAVEQPRSACMHDHCVAALRSTPRTSQHVQLTMLTEPAPWAGAPTASLRDATLRAPPQAVRLADICVSRT